MAYEVVMSYHLHMPSYFLGTFTEYPFVIPLRFERKTHALEGRCSIQLSYGTILNCGAKVRFFMKTTNFTPKIFIIYIKIIGLYMKSR